MLGSTITLEKVKVLLAACFNTEGRVQLGNPNGAPDQKTVGRTDLIEMRCCRNRTGL